ncbi:MAG: hypothetical protein CME65_16015 [Halobacteriovoraceae bacterium]|nr:hypothetical protein [Halobacteriovoraceae bacterium]
MRIRLLPLLFCFVPYAYSVELEGILHTQSPLVDIENSKGEASQENLDSQELDTVKAGAASIDDILRLSPVATTARGPRSSGEAPQVRGLDQNKIFVSIDGARQNFQTGHNSMIGLDTENLKVVDIFTSSSDISNSGSLGGGVNFVTKDAKDLLRPGAKEGGEFKTRYASANAENSFNGKYAFKEKDRSGLVSMSSTTAKNLQLSNGETLTFSSFEDQSVLIKNKYKKFGIKLEAFQRKDNAPTDPTLNPPREIQELLSENTITRTTLAFEYETNIAKGQLAGQAYFNGFGIEKTEEASQETKTRRIETLGAKLDYKVNRWTIGGEVFNDQLSSDWDGEEIESYPSAQSRNTVLYAKNDISLGEKNTLTPGLRWNTYSMQAGGDFDAKSDSALSSALILKTKWTSKFQTIASVSQGYRAPRLNEVYPSGLHSPGDGFIIRDNFFLPNEDLKEETSLSRELKLKYQDFFDGGNGQVTFKASAYENDFNDYIILRRIDRSILDPIDGTTQFVNIDEASLYGGELELSVLYDAYETGIGYSQIRGRNESEDLWLEDLPADQYNFKFNYFLDRYGLTFGYLGSYALEQHRVNPQTIQRTDKTNSYFIHNIYASKKINDFQVDFRVDNFTNQEYRRHASFLFEAREDYKLAITYKVKTL